MHGQAKLRRFVVGSTLVASGLGVGFAVPAAQAFSPTIMFDGSPGTGAPPATLGGYSMTAFADDPATDFSTVTSAPGPTGDVTFGENVQHRDNASTELLGGWSHGYAGDVYTDNLDFDDATVLTLPANTRAFYFYAMGNSCVTQNVTATSQDGATSGPVSVDTNCSANGPKYFGFYSTAADDITTITVTNDAGFGSGNIVGEFAIASAGDGTWPFDDQVSPTADTGVNGNDLTLAGATFVPSPFGHALSLTGATGVNAENAAPVGLPVGGSARTLAAWIKPVANDPGGAIIAYGDGAVGDQQYMMSIVTVLGVTYLFTDGVNGANNIVLTGTQIPPAGSWSHVALVLDGANGWTYYLNGVSTATGTFTVPINTAVPTVVRVGDRSDGGAGQPPFSGVIDSAAIYAHALTGAEVLALTANTAPVCTSPVSGSTNEDVALSSSVVCTDSEAGVLTYSKVAGPSHGTATVNANGTFTYTPASNYNGPDSFTFKAYDGIVYSNTATYNVTVNAVQDASTVTNTAPSMGIFTNKKTTVVQHATVTSTDPACAINRLVTFLVTGPAPSTGTKTASSPTDSAGKASAKFALAQGNYTVRASVAATTACGAGSDTDPYSYVPPKK